MDVSFENSNVKKLLSFFNYPFGRKILKYSANKFVNKFMLSSSSGF
jgi:hypothetical protein